ncbi:MAG: SH3 domain-containing protein [Bdellovibrionales bacterium]|nr:SH3 domain-containing protein [Bdellovibrionales bacterium]
MKTLSIFLVTLVAAAPAWGQSLEEELMIETETAIADSEAALQEAKEAEKIASEEKKRSDVVVRKAQRELEEAKREEAKAKRDIARAERERTRAIEDAEKAKVEADEAKQAILLAKDELQDINLKLEDSKRMREEAYENKKKVEDEMREVTKNLQDLKNKLQEAKKDELAAVKALGRAERGLKDLEEKAAISYKTADKDTSIFLSAVASHRDTLRKISKKLDELEIEVETDKNFYDKQRRRQLTRTLGSTVATTNGKIAKVMTEGCNIRNFPSLSSKVLGKTARGIALKVKKYNNGWYSVVYDGQKAFMGAGCFQ